MDIEVQKTKDAKESQCLSMDEQRIIDIYRQLNADGKMLLNEYAKTIINTPILRKERVYSIDGVTCI